MDVPWVSIKSNQDFIAPTTTTTLYSTIISFVVASKNGWYWLLITKGRLKGTRSHLRGLSSFTMK